MPCDFLVGLPEMEFNAVYLAAITRREDDARAAEPVVAGVRRGKRCLQRVVDAVAQRQFKRLKDGIERFGQGQVPQVAPEQEFRGVACAMLEAQTEPVCRKRCFCGREKRGLTEARHCANVPEKPRAILSRPLQGEPVMVPRKGD
jgi:hypothetical protein